MKTVPPITQHEIDLEIEGLRQELERLEGWRSIETAPKDGSEFLALTDYGKVCVMYFFSGDICRATTCRRCGGMGLGGLTHWHVLPESPILIGE